MADLTRSNDPRLTRLVGRLLEMAARATPATVEDRGNGWWLRHTDNSTWWSGAVLAHGPADRLPQRIDAAERFYAEHDSVARFHVCSDCPAGLDRLLADRGYRLQAPISLLTAVGRAATGEDHIPPGVTVRVDITPCPEWLTVLSTTGRPEADVAHEMGLIRQINQPQAYVTVLADGEPVGIGRAVVEGGWTGVFTMTTSPQARRRGVARLVLSRLARWAETRGAPRLYLQVEQSNNAADGLYRATGFTQLATYHYRVHTRLRNGLM